MLPEVIALKYTVLALGLTIFFWGLEKTGFLEKNKAMKRFIGWAYMIFALIVMYAALTLG